MRFWNSEPLVRVNTYTKSSLFASDLYKSTVTGLTASTEDNISTVLQSLTCSGSTPLRISERSINTTRVVSLDYFNIRVHVLSTVHVTFTESYNRWNQISSQNFSNDATLRHRSSQSTSQETSLIFREDQPSYTINRRTLELVNTNKVNIRILSGSYSSCLTKSETNSNDHIATILREQPNIGCIILSSCGLNVINSSAHLISSTLNTFPR